MSLHPASGDYHDYRGPSADNDAGSDDVILRMEGLKDAGWPALGLGRTKSDLKADASDWDDVKIDKNANINCYRRAMRRRAPSSDEDIEKFKICRTPYSGNKSKFNLSGNLKAVIGGDPAAPVDRRDQRWEKDHTDHDHTNPPYEDAGRAEKAIDHHDGDEDHSHGESMTVFVPARLDGLQRKRVELLLLLQRGRMEISSKHGLAMHDATTGQDLPIAVVQQNEQEFVQTPPKSSKAVENKAVIEPPTAIATRDGMQKDRLAITDANKNDNDKSHTNVEIASRFIHGGERPRPNWMDQELGITKPPLFAAEVALSVDMDTDPADYDPNEPRTILLLQTRLVHHGSSSASNHAASPSSDYDDEAPTSVVFTQIPAILPPPRLQQCRLICWLPLNCNSHNVQSIKGKLSDSDHQPYRLDVPCDPSFIKNWFWKELVQLRSQRGEEGGRRERDCREVPGERGIEANRMAAGEQGSGAGGSTRERRQINMANGVRALTFSSLQLRQVGPVELGMVS
ncbi:hypothetical protein BJ742DRAFT_871615 [Cladochytrium replicatum]|nr:hypothetical protein BJ742DRAFT_871615 [Cladochytrium replicatum]